MPIYLVGLGRTKKGFETRAFSSLHGFQRPKASWVIDLGWNTHNPSNNPRFLTNCFWMIVLKYLVYILQKRNAAVFHNVCPQLLIILGTTEHKWWRSWSHNPWTVAWGAPGIQRSLVALCRVMYTVVESLSPVEILRSLNRFDHFDGWHNLV